MYAFKCGQSIPDPLTFEFQPGKSVCHISISFESPHLDANTLSKKAYPSGN